ncbi:unnamed protein product [Spirodela intermedia]|uniref:Uncharacterized protein n=1 Tax=Spirodela intermedia TaxID=51605 RepID=A0A7I8IG49_SPIIN|nr:unnamed protein product [Spirodela intermedia]CAA6656880.1 unnamed protein product [Spirodela intermedia]
MAEGSDRSPPQSKSKAEFSIYQNPAFSAVLTANSLQPPKSTVAIIFAFCVASGATLISVIFRADGSFEKFRLLNLSDSVTRLGVRIFQIFVGLVFAATLSALARISLLRSYRNSYETQLTRRQLGLLGMKQKSTERPVAIGSSKKPSKPTAASYSPEPLVPLRTLANSYTPTRPSRVGAGQWVSTGGKHSSPQPVPSPATPPRLKQSSVSGKGISTEEMLEQFLVDVDKRMTESATKTVTPPPTTGGFGIISPSSVTTPGTTPGATRSTPLRAARMSPGSHQKYSTPPKKGEGELPSPMSMEQTVEALESLGIYPYIEQWRDNLRQWFSSVLLNPLVDKIETSHIQTVLDRGSEICVVITWFTLLYHLTELAEGTCIKNYEFTVGEAYDKVNRKWTPELPTDSHLLSYLFCAFLDHPKWMLHVEPASYSSTQSSKNPLFPEKYVAVVSTVPDIIHTGACILVIGKQNPPIFALYWDKKLQFSLQVRRTALWDAVLLLCHRIQVGYGGIVRGVHLGSSAFSILPILQTDCEE